MKKLYKQCNCTTRHKMETDCYGNKGYYHIIDGYITWVYSHPYKFKQNMPWLSN